MKLELSAEQTRWLRLRAQRLVRSDGQRQADTPSGVLQAVCGVQAQDLGAARLSIRARSTGLTAAQVEAERQVSASIAWTWCLRGTLHLTAAQDALWLVPLLGQGFIAGDQRRLKQLGWDEAKIRQALHLLEQALIGSDGLTRSEIRQLLQAHDLPYQGQAVVHLIYRAAFEGRLCAGPDREGETCYVDFASWLGSPLSLPRPQGLRRLAQRYLEAYAPAAPQDLASWSGLKLNLAREAWEIASQPEGQVDDGEQLIAVQAAGEPAWMLEKQLAWLEETGEARDCVRLLPRFDTYLLGYAHRNLSLDPAFARRIHPGGGIIHPALLVNGQVQGTWKLSPRGGRLELHIDPFGILRDELIPLIEAEVQDLGRFLGKAVVWRRDR